MAKIFTESTYFQVVKSKWDTGKYNDDGKHHGTTT